GRACRLSPCWGGAFPGAYAGAGRFAEAIQAVRRARERFAASGLNPLAEMAGRRLGLCPARQPSHQK
ncbi:MAG TPA: hypothetical protein PKJ00_14020, partial [Verrucomicrobiota bacterium]|nr:hypothetical protein [Verrucomicrobiota bacterium]HNS70023.1 hypothetical protein [Verrucomicrobiota bacterium]